MYYSPYAHAEIHKSCVTGASRGFVNDGERQSGACRPPDTGADYHPTIAGPKSHLHPHLRTDILRQ